MTPIINIGERALRRCRAGGRIAFVAGLLAWTFVGAAGARGQSYSILHNFTGGADGGNPEAGLIADSADHFPKPDWFSTAREISTEAPRRRQ